MVVVIEKNANGKIEFTKEELEELLEKARQEGRAEAQRNNYIYTNPSNPAPSTPLNPYVSPFTCQTPQPIPCDMSKSISDTTSTGTTIKINGAEATNGI